MMIANCKRSKRPTRKLQPDRMDALVVRDDVLQGVAGVVCYGRGPLPAQMRHASLGPYLRAGTDSVGSWPR